MTSPCCWRKLCIQMLTVCMLMTLVRIDAAKILAIYPIPSISHQIVFRPLTLELVSRGHDVTVITTDPAFPIGQSPPPNLKEIDVREMSYKILMEHFQFLPVGSDHDVDAHIDWFFDLYFVLFKIILLSKEVQDLITNKEIHFDLVLTENCVQSTLIYAHIFKAPVVQVSSFGPMIGANVVVGASNHPIFQPIVIRRRLYSLTVWEMLREVYRQFKMEYNILYSHKSKESVTLRKMFGPDTPTLDDLLNRVDMVFVNLNIFWNDNSPIPTSLNYMGAVHLQTTKDLPKEIQSYLDSSKNGVIYVSFGSNVQASMLPEPTINMMIKVLSGLPYDVIWKWETDLPEKPKNIKVFRWLPQFDLLRHPKLKLFLTQGGLQSTDEAVMAGVPLIGIPVLGDQWYNAEKYVKLGIGKKLELESLTEEDFKDAVITVIANESYRNNVLRHRTLVLDQPQTPLERSVRWIEHVLHHGGARHLRSAAANMSWMEYYELELVAILSTCLLTIMFAFIMALSNIKHLKVAFFTTQQTRGACLVVPAGVPKQE